MVNLPPANAYDPSNVFCEAPLKIVLFPYPILEQHKMFITSRTAANNKISYAPGFKTANKRLRFEKERGVGAHGLQQRFFIHSALHHQPDVFSKKYSGRPPLRQ